MNFNLSKIASSITLSFALPLGLIACSDSTSANDELFAQVESSSSKVSSSTDSKNKSSESKSKSSDSKIKSSESKVTSSESSKAPESSSDVTELSSSSTGPSIPTGTITDTRDGKVYKVTKIGIQVWMAQNLSYGDSSLYVYADAMKVCPEGFHLPSIKELATLVEYAGGADVASKKLKSTAGWPKSEEYGDWNGTDDYGFNAMPITLGNGKGTDENFWSSDRNYSNYMTENFLKLDPYPTSQAYPDELQQPRSYDFVSFCDGQKTASPNRTCFVSGEPDTRLSVRCLSNKLDCGGKVIDYTEQFCQDDVVYDLCRGREYDGKKYVCKENNLYDRATDSVYKFSWVLLNKQLQYGLFLDKRDGQYYKTIEIDGVTWFAENLNYEIEGSICHEFNPIHCDFYGRMYTHKQVLNGADSIPTGKVQGICPEGTHVATYDEYKKLEDQKYDLETEYYEDDYKGSIMGGDNSVGFSLVYPGFCNRTQCGSERSWEHVNLQTHLIASDGVNAFKDWDNSGLFKINQVGDEIFGSVRCIVD